MRLTRRKYAQAEEEVKSGATLSAGKGLAQAAAIVTIRSPLARRASPIFRTCSFGAPVGRPLFGRPDYTRAARRRTAFSWFPARGDRLPGAVQCCCTSILHRCAATSLGEDPLPWQPLPGAAPAPPCPSSTPAPWP